MVQPVISVIVPFYNEESYIEQCLWSLVSQDMAPERYEVLFVDNQSTDRSAGIVRRFPGVVLLTEPRRSAYHARNRALRQARGEIIAFTDADCVVAPDWLRVIERTMREKRAKILLGHRMFAPEAGCFVRLFQDYENAKIRYVLSHGQRQQYFGFTNNMAVHRAVFDRLGPFESCRIVGDTDLIFRLATQEPEAVIQYVPQMRVTHLEIKTALDWIRKMASYGGAHAEMMRGQRFCHLSLQDRMCIQQTCFQEYGYSLWKKFFSGVVLFFGMIVFEACFYAGRWRNREKSR